MKCQFSNSGWNIPVSKADIDWNKTVNEIKEMTLLTRLKGAYNMK